jgi:hypothetical protein
MVLRRDFLWVGGPSLVAVAPDLGEAAGEFDRGRLNNSTKVLILETWVHQPIALARP